MYSFNFQNALPPEIHKLQPSITYQNNALNLLYIIDWVRHHCYPWLEPPPLPLLLGPKISDFGGRGATFRTPPYNFVRLTGDTTPPINRSGSETVKNINEV